MARSDPTVHYLQNKRPDFRSCEPARTDIPPNRIPAARLSWTFPPDKSCPTEAQFAQTIDRSAVPDAQFFLDTCFLTDHELDAALLESLLRKHMVITPPVWDELQPWLEDPFYNESVAPLQRIDSDVLRVFAYCTGPNLTKEGGHGRTGKVRGRCNRGNHPC